MAFSMFSSQVSPIAVDFGTSSLKVLQIASGDRPLIVAAAEAPIPDVIRSDPEKRHAMYMEELPQLLSKAKFKGKKVIFAIPAAHTFTQHMQLVAADGTSIEELMKSQLVAQMGCAADSIVVRSVQVGDVNRHGQNRREVICFAIGRDTIMRHVDLLKRCKLNVVGVHTEAAATVKAFDHLNRRASDTEVTTLYVDMGWGGTQVAIAHGKEMRFARYIQIGGRHFDQLISEALHCDMTHARAHRLSLQGPVARATRSRLPENATAEGAALLNVAASAHATDVQQRHEASASATATGSDRRVGMIPPEYCAEVEPGTPRSKAATVDLTELMDTVADELSMCLRYHHGLFPERPIDRAIFLGGEARQVWLCQHVVKILRLSAQLGDPLARMSRDSSPRTPGLELDEPQPGWAVACGLCASPTDL